MKKYLLLLLFVTAGRLFAQTSYTNAVWHHGAYGYAPWILYSFQTKAQNDTLVNGVSYTAFDIRLSNATQRIYLREENRITYYFFRNKELTLFNFNAEVGDTITVDVLSEYSNLDTTQLFEQEKVRIKEVFYTFNPITGDSLKRLVYEFVDLDRGEKEYGITEHLLHEKALSGNIFTLTDDKPTIGGISFLRCFESDSLQYKETNAYINQTHCDYSNVGINDVRQAEPIKSYPNPAIHSISLSGAEYNTVSIYNHLGQLVIALYNPPATLSISELGSGLYYVQATDKNGTLSYGKFIKR